MLKHRLVSGLLLGAMVPVLAFGAPPFVVLLFLVLIVVLGQHEFYAMLREGGLPVYSWLGILFGGLWVVATFLTAGYAGSCHLPFFGEAFSSVDPLKAEISVLTLAVLALITRSLWQRAERKPIEAVAGTFMGLLYVPFLFNFITRLAFQWGPALEVSRVTLTGGRLCLFLVIVVKMSDIGAYFSGRAFGKHKMFPRVSPKKTWEGAIGGVTASLAASLIFWLVSGQGRLGASLNISLVDAVLLGILLPVAGMVGDLCESQVKRASGAKDSSSLIPGMGGILDVLDSLLFGAPVLYLYVIWTV